MLQSFLGGELFGDIFGPRPINMLALHGWMRDHTDYAGILPEAIESNLASSTGCCGILAPDLPGFGATPPPATAWGSKEYADLVARLLDAEIGEPVVVIGHSFGGRVAVRLAVGRPDLVSSLVLTGAPLARVTQDSGHGKRRRTTPAYRLGRKLNKIGIINDRRMEGLRRKYGSYDYAHATGIMRNILVRLLAENYEDDLSAIACPTEVVWGEDDRDVPLEVARVIAKTISGATLTVLPGVGHLVPVEAAGALWKAACNLL